VNRTEARHIFAQRPVRPDVVVVIGVTLQNLPQMSLAQDDEVIEALAPDRSDQPFRKAVLPGCPGAMGLSRMPMARMRRRATGP
jgi:hypothetical protein